MTFQSILFEKTQDRDNRETPQAPAFFVDLNLDQVIDAITAGKQEYDLKPFFYVPLHDVDAVQYRQQIMQELEHVSLFAKIGSFAKKLRAMREHLAQAAKLYYKYQKESWFLDAVKLYCDAVTRLAQDLESEDLSARGWLAFREYLTSYANSPDFVRLAAETDRQLDALAAIRYCILINGNRVQVRKYESETDYSKEVEATFEKFKQGAVKDYRVKYTDGSDMNHVEAQIVKGVAELYPEVFSNLDAYCARNTDFLDETLRVFDREIQFYVAYLDYIGGLKRAGLKFCYPKVSTTCKHVLNNDGFDIALAYKLVNAKASVVCNDFYLQDKERIIVVTGPNQGGKTTFARTFGQLHYLAAVGCPVPGRQAQLFLFDALYTHFEKEESIVNLRGKLEDDLVRIHDILQCATPKSIIILNEIFTSTTYRDALFLSTELMKKIIDLDLLCVCVTFLDDLACLSEKNVSMVSTVVPENPELRTYKVVRKPADGLAYAVSIAKKYRVTYENLRERLRA